jgi:hypothetical protein
LLPLAQLGHDAGDAVGRQDGQVLVALVNLPGQVVGPVLDPAQAGVAAPLRLQGRDLLAQPPEVVGVEEGGL